MKLPQYFRPASHLYTLRSHRPYNFEVGRAAERQVLWGSRDGRSTVLWFPGDGDLEEVHSGGAPPPATGGVIQVRRFWYEDVEAGIEDLPEDLAEFVHAPDSSRWRDVETA